MVTFQIMNRNTGVFLSLKISLFRPC